MNWWLLWCLDCVSADIGYILGIRTIHFDIVRTNRIKRISKSLTKREKISLEYLWQYIDADDKYFHAFTFWHKMYLIYLWSLIPKYTFLIVFSVIGEVLHLPFSAWAALIMIAINTILAFLLSTVFPHGATGGSKYRKEKNKKR